MNDDRTPLAKSSNGIEVWYNLTSSHAATHINDTPGLDKLAAEVIEQSKITGNYMQFHLDMSRIVGVTDLVKNDEGDEIIYAKRLNRGSYTAFNKSKVPQPSSLVTIAVEKKNDGTYELVSAWIGRSDLPDFPGGVRETAESKKFWSNHSLAWGNQEIQPGTKTTVCPWEALRV